MACWWCVAVAETHVINLTEVGWTLRHPLSCRPNLFDCPVGAAAQSLAETPPAGCGLFLADLDEQGALVVGREATPADLAGEPATRTEAVLRHIGTERLLQDEKWGEQNHLDGTGGNEAAADLARLVCQQAARAGQLSWRYVLDEEVQEAFAESDPARLRAELVQVAAVAVAWIEAIDRRGNRG